MGPPLRQRHFELLKTTLLVAPWDVQDLQMVRRLRLARCAVHQAARLVTPGCFEEFLIVLRLRPSPFKEFQTALPLRKGCLTLLEYASLERVP